MICGNCYINVTAVYNSIYSPFSKYSNVLTVLASDLLQNIIEFLLVVLIIIHDQITENSNIELFVNNFEPTYFMLVENLVTRANIMVFSEGANRQIKPIIYLQEPLESFEISQCYYFTVFVVKLW